MVLRTEHVEVSMTAKRSSQKWRW